jgi:hypothetical protein
MENFAFIDKTIFKILAFGLWLAHHRDKSAGELALSIKAGLDA